MSAPINPRGGFVVATPQSTVAVTPVVSASPSRQANPLRAQQAREVHMVSQAVIVQNPPSMMYVPHARLISQPAVVSLQAPPPAVIVSSTGVNPRDVTSYTVSTRDGGTHTDINAGALARKRF